MSSSAIREALRDGDVEQARAFLGRPYSLTGTVQRGAGRGRTLGFPTANLKPDRPLVLAAGVYAARARWDGRQAEAVVNIGYRPTFEESQYWVEAYLFDFAGDLYDRTLTLDFLDPDPGRDEVPGRGGPHAQVRADMAEARRAAAGPTRRGDRLNPSPPRGTLRSS